MKGQYRRTDSSQLSGNGESRSLQNPMLSEYRRATQRSKGNCSGASRKSWQSAIARTAAGEPVAHLSSVSAAGDASDWHGTERDQDGIAIDRVSPTARYEGKPWTGTESNLNPLQLEGTPLRANPDGWPERSPYTHWPGLHEGNRHGIQLYGHLPHQGRSRRVDQQQSAADIRALVAAPSEPMPVPLSRSIPQTQVSRKEGTKCS